MEQRKSYKDAKGEAQAGKTPVRPKTEALYDGGLNRSSVEAPVMGVERRVEVIQLELPLTTLDKQGRDDYQTNGMGIVQESTEQQRSSRDRQGDHSDV
jgi:hypothetical protein